MLKIYKKTPLKIKLSLLCIALVIAPAIAIGGFSFQQFRAFGKSTVTETYDALTEQTLKVLNSGIKNDRQLIQTLIEKAENDTKKLALSGSTKNYLSARLGKNEVLNRIAEKEAAGISKSIFQICKAQRGLLEKKLESDLAVSSHILESQGGIEIVSLTAEWEVFNPDSKEKNKLVLPMFQVGFDTIHFVDSFEETVPIVDDAKKLIGSSCAIFQRANPEGDMICIATSVKNSKGLRATGTYLPALSSDGKVGPAIKAALQKKNFHGRSRVGDDWYLSAYKPIIDESGEVAGMFSVGINEKENEGLIDTISSMKIGKKGYVAIMDSSGTVLLHPSPDLIGKNVITDLNIKEFQRALESPQKSELISFNFSGEKLFYVQSYFEDWDWIILGIGYWDEFSQEETAKNMLKDEIKSLFQNSTVAIGEKLEPLYSQIRYIDESGKASVIFENGKFSDFSESFKDVKCFEESKSLKEGHILNLGLIREAEKDLLRVISPVFFEKNFMGIVSLDFKWSLVWQLLKSRVYGKSGYNFIVNNQGIIVSHPKYSLKDQINLEDKKFGKLAEIVSQKMLKGEENYADYNFEGINKFMSYAPLKVGEKIYSMAVTVPENEFLSLANGIREKAESGYSRVIKGLIITALVLVMAGAFIGLFFSVSLSGAIKKVIQKLTEGANQVTLAFEEISLNSQQMAEGAAEQAASLQQTSASLEELTVMTRQNANHASFANDLMKEISEVVNKANEAMNELNLSMKAISETSVATKHIINSIDKIAFQTNLLALNAAVEAARAGQMGAGFAVVAEEVRKLAINTTQAAQKTALLLEESAHRIQSGSSMVDKNNGIFRVVSEHAGKAIGLIGEIAAASQEQAYGIEQINNALAQMDKVTQQNAVNAQGFASASHEMNGQAEDMRWIVCELATIVDGFCQNGKNNSGNGNGANGKRKNKVETDDAEIIISEAEDTSYPLVISKDYDKNSYEF